MSGGRGGDISALYSAQEETVSSVKISNEKLQVTFISGR